MKYTKIAVILFTAMLAATVVPVSSYAAETYEAVESEQEASGVEDYIASGVIDEDYGQITWMIDSEGKLSITGTGDVSALNVYAEYKRIPWYSYRDQILSAKIDVEGMTDASYLFFGCSNLRSLDVSNFDTSSVTNMRHIFCGCYSLQSLDVSNFDTSNVTDMSGMFSSCDSLTSVNVSNFDTGNVTDMSDMFSSCDSLTSVNVSNFDTSNVTDMSGMFSSCDSLTSVNVSNFDTSHVTDMSEMFKSSGKLKSLDLSDFDTSSVTDMSRMFCNCESLESLDLSGFDTGNVVYMHDMFYRCSSLESLDLSSFDMVNLTERTNEWTNEILFGCSSLKQIQTPVNCQKTIMLPVEEGESWQKENGLTITRLPQGWAGSITIHKVSFVSDLYEVASGMIDEDYGRILWELDSEGKLTVSGNGDISDPDEEAGFERIPWYPYAWEIQSAEINVEGMVDASYLFFDCGILTNVDLDSFDTCNVTNMSHMFEGCQRLKGLDLSGFDTTNVTDMSSMFEACNALKSIDVTAFDTANVTNMMNMFSGCQSIKTLDLSSFDTKKVTNITGMFEGCISLKCLDISNFDLSGITEEVTGYWGESMFSYSSVNKIETPVNCHVRVGLSVNYDTEFWQTEDGVVITELPQSLSDSITIYKRAVVQEFFKDVAEGAWYTNAVQYVYDNGIMEGNDDKFTPNGKMTRGMFVTTLYRLAGEPEITDYSACEELKDVSEGAWYTDAVCWAYTNGITTGYESDRTFRTNVALTREQLATFLYRYAQYQELDVDITDDLSGLLNADKVKPYAEKEVKWAVGAGMISGLESADADGTTVYDLAPQKTATRAQLASILMRFCENYDI